MKVVGSHVARQAVRFFYGLKRIRLALSRECEDIHRILKKL